MIRHLRRILGVFAMVYVFLLFLPGQAWAFDQPPKYHDFGIGIALGSPTALTFKYWQNPDHAVDGGLGYWYGAYTEVYADYLWHWSRAFSGSREPGPQFVPYIGVGGDFHVSNGSQPVNDYYHPSLGFYVRVPFGMEWLPPRAPFGVFVEIVPDVAVVPGIYALIGAAIGGRFYF